MIKLKGALDWELTRLGLEAGDIFADHTPPDKNNGAVHFDTHYNGFRVNCVVWPDNYDIINETSK